MVYVLIRLEITYGVGMRCTTVWIISRLGKERYSNRMNSFPVWSNNNTVMHAIVVIVVLCEHH